MGKEVDSKTIRRLLLEKIISGGYQITPDALRYLANFSSSDRFVEEILSKPYSLKIPNVITHSFLVSLIEKEAPVDSSRFVDLRVTTNLDREAPVDSPRFVDLKVTTNLDRESKIRQKLNVSEWRIYSSLLGTELDDDEYVSNIDLTPLSGCKNIRVLKLNRLGLKSVDLEPLRHCTLLEEFHFFGPEPEERECFEFSYYVSHGRADPGELLKKIDLSPLANCRKLRVLTLSGLNLESIDLEPLKACKELEELNILDPIRLRRPDSFADGWIDLTPLAECPNLRIFTLKGFRNVDFNPLRNCTSLETVRIQHGDLSEIDLSILSNCLLLREIDLSENPLRTIDLGPLGATNVQVTTGTFICERKGDTVHPTVVTLLSEKGHPELEHQRGEVRRTVRFYDIPVKITSIQTIEAYYNTLKQNEEPLWKILHLIQCVPTTIGMKHTGLLDADPDRFLRDIFQLAQEPESVTMIQERYVEALCTQIDQGGTTIGIDLEDDPPPEIMVRIDKILALREEEMRRVNVSMEDGIVDYHPLWSTAHGCRVLTSLRKTLKDDKNGFKEVEIALSNAGYKIDGSQKGRFENSCLSNAMKEYIKVMCNISKRWRWINTALTEELVMEFPFFTR
ncbi:MAG: leucine-rich repeat protein [Candidatus Thorarchaeota archaeon]